MDDNGNFIKPETPNGYKFETLILDMIHMLDTCLPFEVERNKEFAPMLYFATNKERRTYTMRDTGSVWKKSRYLNMSVTETGKELKKRAYAPGQHGANKKRKTSEYGVV